MSRIHELRQRLMDKFHRPRRNKLKHDEASPPQSEHIAASLYAYEPLDTSIPGQFRLLELAAGPTGSKKVPIRCTLATANWSSEATVYEALSYVWGDPTQRRRILVNSVEFSVTKNLFLALSYLRHPDKPRILWIDAICIDQTSITERNHQVAVMSEIYRRCSQVLVWLGEADDETPATVQFIASIADTMRSDDGMPGHMLGVFNHTLSSTMLAKLYNSGNVAQWNGVFLLVNKPWWRRAWVLQEFAFAPNAMFMVGIHLISWQRMFSMVKIFSKSPIIHGLDLPNLNTIAVDVNDMMYTRIAQQHIEHNTLGNISSSNTVGFLDHDLRSSGISLILLLGQQRLRGCENPRDKLYSILGLAGSKVSGALIPDYKKSVRWTYTQVVKVHIKIYQDLDVLNQCMYAATGSPFPSWCPDWTQQQNLSPIRRHKSFNASGLRFCNAEISHVDSVLRLAGVKVGTIQNACIQASVQAFNYRTSATGTECSWNFDDMVARIAAADVLPVDLQRVHDDHVDEVNCSTSEKDKKLRESLFQTLTFGHYLDLSIWYIPPPFLVKDKATGEWWPEDRPEFYRQVARSAWGRTVVMAQNGYLGLAPACAQTGDEIFILYGGYTPFVLRPVEDGMYNLIGDAYVHGVMQGEALEAMERGLYKEERLMIR